MMAHIKDLDRFIESQIGPTVHSEQIERWHGSAMKSQILLTVALMLFAMVAAGMHHQLEPRQSSDGCGPNPLVAVIAYAREFADFSPQQLMRFIEADTRAGSQLRTLLRAYDDCVRTGDGTRYKKSGGVQYREESPYEDFMSNNLRASVDQVNQSLLRALGDQRRPTKSFK